MGDTNVNIKHGQAESQIAVLRAETQAFMSEMEESYQYIQDMLVKSSGDFIDSLKEQFNSELLMLENTGTFFLTLLQMLESAGLDFASLDTNYAAQKSIEELKHKENL